MADIKMPQIVIEFKKLANSAEARSAVGTVILLMRDKTQNKPMQMFDRHTFADAASDFTSKNAQYITDAFTQGAATVATVRIGDNITDALNSISASTLSGWIAICDGLSVDFTALTTWIKTAELTNRCPYYGIVFNGTAPNSAHIVNFSTSSVTFTDERGAQSGAAYLPSLAGILAGCGITNGCTYHVCDNLSAASATLNPDSALNEGKFFLVTDGSDIRIARGINSYTDGGEDERFIDIVVVVDLIREDIIRTWKSEFAGRLRNTLNNQMLFVAAVNTYLDNLAAAGVLDSAASNAAEIDVGAQRTAWLEAGRTEAQEWSEDTVRASTFRRNVYLAATIRIAETMDNLYFPITML